MLILLCTSLIAWRLNSRIEQYHPSSTGAPVPAAFFDANERNITLLEASRVPFHPTSEPPDTLTSLENLQPLPAPPIHRIQLDQSVLPPVLIYSVTLFSNPPPSSLI
jgi:hypothetical protein